MSTFLKVRHIPSSKWYKRSRWLLLDSLEISGHIIPKDFITDGATIPLPLTILFSPTGRYMRDATLHDYLLSRIADGESRKYADDQFLKSMKEHNIAKWRHWSIYMTVRLYGIIKTFYYNNLKHILNIGHQE